MNAKYFSDRERGLRARVSEEISHKVWIGIESYINNLIAKGAFGATFPKECSDGRGTYSNDEQTFTASLNVEIPDLDWPVFDATPETLDILDLIEFCYDAVSEPIELDYHSYMGHTHLDFDRERGQATFLERINSIFARNGLAFELRQSGTVTRLAPPVLRELLNSANFETGDVTLDTMLETARVKFLNPSPFVRSEALEKLWDAWERLKTIEEGNDKKASITNILNKSSSRPAFRQFLEDEARKLTEAGNRFQIRHSETTQEALERSEHVDYLFHRLFSMIQLLTSCRALDT